MERNFIRENKVMIQVGNLNQLMTNYREFLQERKALGIEYQNDAYPIVRRSD